MQIVVRMGQHNCSNKDVQLDALKAQQMAQYQYFCDVTNECICIKPCSELDDVKNRNEFLCKGVPKKLPGKIL